MFLRDDYLSYVDSLGGSEEYINFDTVPPRKYIRLLRKILFD